MERGASHRPGGNVCVHGRIALSSPHAAGPDPDGPRQPARAGASGHGTGVLELIGAIGLLVPQALPAAAYGLIALLVAMFPANVHAAREGLAIAGRRAMPLVWRVPLQLFWIAALWWVRSSTPTL